MPRDQVHRDEEPAAHDHEADLLVRGERVDEQADEGDQRGDGDGDHFFTCTAGVAEHAANGTMRPPVIFACAMVTMPCSSVSV